MPRLVFVLLFASLVGSAVSAAPTPAATVSDPASFDLTSGTLSRAVGWTFRPTSNITVTALGVYDFGAAGLVDNHNIGLFTGGGTRLASTLIDDASPDTTLASGTWFRNLDSPVSLTSGVRYYLLADNWVRNRDSYVFGQPVQIDPVIGWIDGVTGESNDINSFSSRSQLSTRGLLGPNFLFTLPPIPGDYDGDGTVGQGDYQLWASTFGSTGPGHAADGNGNQAVDAADYTLWRDALPALPVAAPEPSAAVLAAILVSAGVRGRREPGKTAWFPA